MWWKYLFFRSFSRKGALMKRDVSLDISTSTSAQQQKQKAWIRSFASDSKWFHYHFAISMCDSKANRKHTRQSPFFSRESSKRARRDESDRSQRPDSQTAANHHNHIKKKTSTKLSRSASLIEFRRSRRLVISVCCIRWIKAQVDWNISTRIEYEASCCVVC